MYKCDVCGKDFGKDFGRKDSYTTHLQGVHGTKSECHKCDFIGYKDQLKMHQFDAHTANNLDSKHNRIRHSCLKCSLQFSRRSSLSRHVQAIHKTTCHICYFDNFDEVSNKSHIDSRHAVLRCSECDKIFGTRSTLSFHMKKHHSKLLPALQAFDCTECEQTFMNNRRLLVHMRTEHLNQWYKCDVCGKDFGRKDSYTTHLLFVHSKPCKLCDFKGSSSDQLKKHMKSHKLECDICHFSTYDHVKFVRHMTTKHQACNNCPFVAENRTEFKKHNCFKRIKKSVVEMQPPIKESKVLQNVETQPPKESEETNVLQCKFCSYQATKEAFLNMHLKNIHKSDKDYKEYTDDPMDDFFNLLNENKMIKKKLK